MTNRKQTIMLFGVIASILTAPALASPAQKRVHPRDYIAHMPVEPDIVPVADAPKADPRPDCFVSLSPMEVTKGIRHWTGKCH